MDNLLEKRVLNGMVQSVERIDAALLARVDMEYFQYPETRTLFSIIKYNRQKYQRVLVGNDLVSLLQQSKTTDERLKPKILTLFEEVQMVDAPANFALTLEEFFTYHKINLVKRAADNAVNMLHDKDPDEALKGLKSDVMEIERGLLVENTDSGYLGRSAFDKYLDRKNHPEKYEGVHIGFPTFDIATHGCKPGTVSLIIGAMKSAKSVLMVNIAQNMTAAGKRVYYHVNEGGKELVEGRFISCATGLVLDRIENSLLAPSEEDIYKTFADKHHLDNLLYIDSVPPQYSTASYIESKINDLSASGKVDIALVDYLGLMMSESKLVKDEWQRMGAITLELKSVAAKTKVPIIMIAHANRDGMSENKKDFDLQDMGLSIEPLKHVDLIMSWRIQDPEGFAINNRGEGRLSVKGARASKCPIVTLDVNTNIMKIQELVVGTVGH